MNDTLKHSKTVVLFEKIKNSKKIQYIIVAVLSILVIIIFCFNFSTSDNSLQSSETDLVTNYVSELEKKLSENLSKVKGAGKVSVVISVQSGMETVLAMNTTKKVTEEGTFIEETPLIINGKTIVLKELYPEIVGVLIVAEGAENITVLRKIQQATTSLLDIDLNQIEILTMK